MAGFVVGPWQVDPALTQIGASPAKVIQRRNEIVQVVWPAMLARLPSLPLVAGFVSERTSTKPGDATLLRNALLQYPFPQTATDAAEALAAGALNVVDHGGGPAMTEPVRPVPIPGHPEATGALMKRLEGTASVHELTVISARGPYVLIQVVQFATPERAAELAGRILDLQVPLIDTFVPTEPAPLASLPRDPSGLLARTVPLKSGQGDSMSDADYDPAGAVQLEDNPIQAGAAMQSAGVDTVAVSETTVYQARDAAAAQQLAQSLGDDIVERQSAQPAAGVPGLAGSRCVRTEDARTRIRAPLVHRHQRPVHVQSRCPRTRQRPSADSGPVPDAEPIGASPAQPGIRSRMRWAIVTFCSARSLPMICTSTSTLFLTAMARVTVTGESGLTLRNEVTPSPASTGSPSVNAACWPCAMIFQVNCLLAQRRHCST